MLIIKQSLELFKELFDECQLKERTILSKGLVIKPILAKNLIHVDKWI